MFLQNQTQENNTFLYIACPIQEKGAFISLSYRAGREQKHLRSGKSYRDIYSVWETALTKKDEFNEKHLKLRQDIKDLLAQRWKSVLAHFKNTSALHRQM